jgi:RNA polymerase sigma-70 factor, ECF subfamily
MEATAALEKARIEEWSDEQVIQRVLAGEAGLYEIIMRRYNQRLYRVVLAILRDDSEVEDVMQEAYVRAYRYLAQFEGRSQFSTWLIRIAVHEALARRRRNSRLEQFAEDDEGNVAMQIPAPGINPEQHASRSEVRQMLEQAILALPENYRAVLVMRDVEEMSTADTAEALSISEENVKTRLHRGHALLRRELMAQAGQNKSQAFAFMGVRCDRMVRDVLRRIAEFSQLEDTV